MCRSDTHTHIKTQLYPKRYTSSLDTSSGSCFIKDRVHNYTSKNATKCSKTLVNTVTILIHTKRCKCVRTHTIFALVDILTFKQKGGGGRGIEATEHTTKNKQTALSYEFS